MGEYVWTDINIGGKASASVGAELRQMLDADFGHGGEIIGRHLYAGGQRNYGNADEVEEFCQKHGLSYVLTWGAASGCFDAGSHAWRPGMESAAEFCATDDGDPSTPLGYLKAEHAKGRTLADIIEELSIGDASALPPYVEEAGEDDADAGQVEPPPASPPSVADDLLAALKTAEPFIRSGDVDSRGGKAELSRLANIMAAAIARAEGKEG